VVVIILKTFSTVLIISCDINYNITNANIGWQGRILGGCVYRKCTFSNKFKNETIYSPATRPLPYRIKSVPYAIVVHNILVV
jgi:hypothetical protein